MTTARMSRRQLAALADVVRTIVEDIAAHGGPVIPELRRALDLVELVAVGGRATKKESDALANAAIVHSSQYGVNSPRGEKAVYWIGTPIALLLQITKTGSDESAQVLTQAGCSLGSLHELEWAAYAARIATMHEAALARHAGVSDEPLPVKKPRVDAKVASRERALLDRSCAALPSVGCALLRRSRAERDAKLHGARDVLAKLLAKHGFPAHDAVLDLEEKFGGLLVPNGAGDRWREENQWGLVGAYGCLTLGHTRAQPLRDLVPVYYGAQDDILYLDSSGRARTPRMRSRAASRAPSRPTSARC